VVFRIDNQNSSKIEKYQKNQPKTGWFFHESYRVLKIFEITGKMVL
jgi:hypothetical protein